jgi:hypothetical protein
MSSTAQVERCQQLTINRFESSVPVRQSSAACWPYPGRESRSAWADRLSAGACS